MFNWFQSFREQKVAIVRKRQIQHKSYDLRVAIVTQISSSKGCQEKRHAMFSAPTYRLPGLQCTADSAGTSTKHAATCTRTSTVHRSTAVDS